MTQTPLVSIIMPVFNGEAFFCESIRSILHQDHANWELWIVDDCSTDGSIAVAKGFAAIDKRIHIIELKENKGAGVARNLGIEQANGHYIAFLDADDLWKPEKLRVQLKFMKEKNASVSYCSYELIDEAGKALGKKIVCLPKLDFKKLSKANYMGNLTAMYDTGKLGKCYMPTMRKRQDWAMWLDIIGKAGVGHGIPDALAYYRLRENSISSNKWEMLRYNHAVFRKHLGYSPLKSIGKMGSFLYEQFFVKPKQTKSLE